jgi:hypothetical protein
MEVRHGYSSIIARGLQGVPAARSCEEDEDGPQARRLLTQAAIYDGPTVTLTAGRFARPSNKLAIFSGQSPRRAVTSFTKRCEGNGGVTGSILPRTKTKA